MNCQPVRDRLSDFLDGELASRDHERLQSHLDACSACREEYESLRSLTLEAGQLEAEMRPSRDLWPGIQARISERVTRQTPWWLQLAAAGIALAVVSVPLSVWWAGRHDNDISTPLQATAVVDESVATRAELARSEDGVLLARTDLVAAIERHRDVVESDTLRIWEENMTILDQAIGELRAALDEDPQNLRLRMLLASRYQQERKLLQKVSRV